MLFSLFLSTIAATAAPTAYVVRGVVMDALTRADGDGHSVWVTVDADPAVGGRRLVRLDGGAIGPRVPDDAVWVDACRAPNGQDRFVFVDDDGVVDEHGARLLPERGLFALADPDVLFHGEVCSAAHPDELRAMVKDGIAVVDKRGETRTLRYPHRARAYAGAQTRGLRPPRPYATALSLYAPRLVDADVNGDGRLDLVVAHEHRLAVFVRDESGALATDPVVVLDLLATLAIDDVEEQDLRVHVSDVDGDGRADALVGVTAGGLPDRSRAFLVASRRSPFDAVRALWDKSSLRLPLGVVVRKAAPRVLVSEADTSLVALGATLISGEVDLNLSLLSVDERAPSSTKGPALAASVDVRRGTRHGALPIVDVDFDGDGLTDLVDIGRLGRAAIHRGSVDGFVDEPDTSFTVPLFTSAVALPAHRAVVLVGPVERDAKGLFTRVTLVRGTTTGAPARGGRAARAP